MDIKYFYSLCVFAGFVLLTGCGQQGANDSVNQRLFKLAHMNGCIECHTVSAATVGPSWMAIAERYKDTPRAEARALLIESVKKGSQGKWLTWKGGGGMPPLGKRVSEEHITELVDFILSLDTSNKG